MPSDTNSIVNDIGNRIDRIHTEQNAQRDEMLATVIRLTAALRDIRDLPSRSAHDAKVKSDRARKALMSVVKSGG